jgi:acyl-CoA thioesterase
MVSKDKLKDQKRINAIILNDSFSKMLEADVEIVEPGHSKVTLEIKETMTNFHGMTHGGVIFSMSDMAFAAACNSYGKVAVALNISINFLKPSYPGDILVAEAIESHSGNKTSLYTIIVKNKKTGDLIAKSQDLAYKKKISLIKEDL